MMTRLVAILCFVFIFVQLGADGSSGGERYVEISEDGHLEYRYSSEDIHEPFGYSERNIPYNTTPDWQNNFRIQVGALQVCDINYDGYNDLIVGCYYSDSYPPYDDWHNFIYFNTGNELEATPSWVSDDEVSTGDIQIADIDGDGYIDIFAANGGYSMDPSVIYFGSATGPSTSPGWYSNDNCWNNYAMPFDFDHDGDIDVLTANQGNNPYDPYRPMYLFVNNNGTLSNTPGWQSSEQSIQNFFAVADVDGDGWEDVAVSKWSGFESGIYRNNNGTLETFPWWTTGTTDTDKGVVFGDVDDNSWTDLALGHNPTQLFSNVEGTFTLSWTSGYSFFGQQDMRFCDVDSDGDLDLAEIHFSNGVVNIYMNDNGELQNMPTWSYDCSSVGTALAFGDINGNGNPDLIVGNSGNPSIMVFYNQGSVSVHEQPIPQPLRVVNYPNPFSNTTTFSFSTTSQAPNELKIYNIKGCLVKEILIQPNQTTVSWDSKDNTNKPVPSGIYFYKLINDEQTITTGKCIVLK